jgi:PAS domain-containing protein
LKNNALRHIAAHPKFLLISLSSPLSLYYTDTEGCCIYTNPAWQNIFRLTEEDALIDGWHRTVHPDDLSWVVKAWQSVVVCGSNFFAGFRIKKNTKECIVRSMATPAVLKM